MVSDHHGQLHPQAVAYTYTASPRAFLLVHAHLGAGGKSQSVLIGRDDQQGQAAEMAGCAERSRAHLSAHMSVSA
eukprot:357234-Chlamydomonas_euryale.AAC.10